MASHWALGTGKHIHRWTIPSDKFVPVPNTDTITFNHVSASSSDKALAVKSDNTITLYEKGAWTAQEGQAKIVALGLDDDRWMIRMDSRPNHWEGNTWVPKPLPDGVGAVYIDMLDKDNVVLTDGAERVYMWKNDQWDLIDKFRNCTFTTIDYKTDGNCGNLYCIDTYKKIWQGLFSCTAAREPNYLEHGSCVTCFGNTICAYSCGNNACPRPASAGTLVAGTCTTTPCGTVCTKSCP